MIDPLPLFLRASVIIFLTVTLSACVSTRVHLFTEALTEEEIISIEALLQNDGYEVVRNSLPIPEGIVTPTILYSPLHKKPADLETLRDLLATWDWYVDLEALSQSNHYYTGQNVGLYPKAFSPDRPSQLTLGAKELFGECEEVDATLSLNPNLTFSATFFSWQEALQKETTRTKEGVWRQNNQIVTLETPNGSHRYKVRKISSTTDYAKIDGLRLTSLSPSVEMNNCNFVYQEMDPW